MRLEFIVLVWGCVLGAIHLFLAVRLKIKQYGSDWSMGARDESLPPPQPLLGRLMRAQSNYFETFPIVVAGIALIGITGLHSRWTAIGALTWLAARCVFLPLYAAGIPVARTVSFIVSVVGIFMLFWPLLTIAVNIPALFR
ncbi:MAG: MAPEG family protein [Pseudomonadota bacterium]